MNTLLDLNNNIMDLACHISGKFEHKNKRVSGCFNGIYNKSVLTYELLTYYYEKWSVSCGKSAEQISAIRQENAERCIDITKSLFVGSFSLIEYNMREIIDNTPNHILGDYINRSKRAYDEFEKLYVNLDGKMKLYFKDFRKILKELPPSDSIGKVVSKSKDKGFIDNTDYQQWLYFIEIRNILVHNNGIAVRNMECRLSGTAYVMVEKEMLEGNLDYFFCLTKGIMLLFEKWANHNYERYKC